MAKTNAIVYVAGGGEGTTRVVPSPRDSAQLATYDFVEHFRDRRDEGEVCYR